MAGKIVQSNHDINRVYTINIEVHRNGPVDVREVIEAINNYNPEYLEYTRCMQQVTRNKFRWSIDSKSRVDDIVRSMEYCPLLVNCDGTAINPARKSPTIILYDTPYELSNTIVRNLMEKYGPIREITRGKVKGFDILDGRVYVHYYKITDDLPDEILLGKSGRILVRQPGQPVRIQRCYKCGETGTHQAEDCPGRTICFKCKLPGHKAFECLANLEKEGLSDEDPDRQKENKSKRDKTADRTTDVDLRPQGGYGGARPKQYNTQMAQSTPTPKNKTNNLDIPDDISGINYKNPEQPAESYIDDMYDQLQPGQRLPVTPIKNLDYESQETQNTQQSDKTDNSDEGHNSYAESNTDDNSDAESNTSDDNDTNGNSDQLDKDFPALTDSSQNQNLTDLLQVFSTPNAPPPSEQTSHQENAATHNNKSYAGATNSTSSPPDKKTRYNVSTENIEGYIITDASSPTRKHRDNSNIRKKNKGKGYPHPNHPPPPIPPRNIATTYMGKLEVLPKKK